MKKTPDEYRRDSHSVTLLNYHFVWCPKRRKKVLVGEVEHRQKLPTLWTTSYFVATTGNASTQTIKRYIESQKGK